MRIALFVDDFLAYEAVMDQLNTYGIAEAHHTVCRYIVRLYLCTVLQKIFNHGPRFSDTLPEIMALIINYSHRLLGDIINPSQPNFNVGLAKLWL